MLREGSPIQSCRQLPDATQVLLQNPAEQHTTLLIEVSPVGEERDIPTDSPILRQIKWLRSLSPGRSGSQDTARLIQNSADLPTPGNADRLMG